MENKRFVQSPHHSTSNPVRRVFPSPVKERSDFFGHSEGLRKVWETLTVTSDILFYIHGERCIGKTSFMNQIKIMLDEGSDQDIRLFHFPIEPTSLQTVEDFAHEIWNGLLNICRNAKPSLSEEIHFTFEGYGRFGVQLREILHGLDNIRFVIFIDELEKIKDTADNISEKQIIGLIRYLIEQTNRPIAFIVSGMKEFTSTLFYSMYGSPPPSREIKIFPLDRGDCDMMLNSLIPLTIEGREKLFERIYQSSGGHPYFAKLLTAEVLDAQRTSPLDQLITDSGWQDLIVESVQTSEANNIFLSLYNSYFNDEERFILLSLAQQADFSIKGHQVAEWKTVHRVAAQVLEQRNYLIPLPDGGYYLRIPMMGDWFTEQWKDYPLETERLGLFTDSTVTDIGKDGICINEASGQVYLDGQEISEKLSNLQYQVLLYLARNTDRVVSRQELFEFLHSKNETYVPTDQSLDALVYRLRLALGDREQHSLQTLRKRGYRLRNVILLSNQ